ncbi:MAG TPA: T9SS type A sorting domain-containing protein, partial [Phaeodactylibacter sp.]|nr:T9SS type A sorting domain-containing protein [Phaeodactylibacter sp.]
FILILISTLVFCFGSAAQIVNIPDANFKAFLVGYTFINSNMDDEIQVSEATAFTGEMYCYNLGITDFTGIEAFTGMTAFGCNGNSLTTLDLSQNTALTHVYCTSTNLTSLVTSPNLVQLYCDNNNLTTLDVSQNTDLIFLACNNNNIESLDVSQNTALNTLHIQENNISTIDLSQNTALASLDLSNNNLTTLDVSQNTALINLKCFFNNLSTLDVSQNTALTTLECNHNSLLSLDVSQNTALTDLKCMVNNISTLDVSQNTALTFLACNNNSIGSLDASQNTALTQLFCGNNSLTSLNLKNINPSTMTVLNAAGNPNLTCIEVDDVAAATAAWQLIDVTSSFSLNCVIAVTSITVQGQAGASEITTAGGTLQMTANVLPTNADDNTYTWSVTDGTGSATINSSGLLTAVADGTVTVTATANDGSGVSGSTVITISNQIVLVTSITVQGQAGASTITDLGGTLQMEASVLPVNANNATYTWSVIGGTGSATINSSGLLTAMADGTVTVTASSVDGSGVSGNAVITISNQNVGIKEQNIIRNLSIYPNPTNAQVIIESDKQIEAITVLDIMGKTVKTIVEPTNTVNLSDLTKGIYFLKIQIDNTLVSKKIIKE